MQKVITLRTSQAIPSQNQLRKEHWAKDHRRGKLMEADMKMDLLQQFKKSERDIIQSRPKFAKITVHSQRTRRITDIGNLIGGSKSFIDALTRLKLIFDDSDEYVKIKYTQKTGGPYFTEVTIEADYGKDL